jgi:aldose 1-epimerase
MKRAMTIAFEATQPTTIINMTNHAIFNLAGEGAPQGDGPCPDHSGQAYTPVDATLIPTGELRPVAGTVFDFTKGAALPMACATARPADRRSAVAMTTTSLDKGLTASPELAARLEDPPRAACLKC